MPGEERSWNYDQKGKDASSRGDGVPLRRIYGQEVQRRELPDDSPADRDVRVFDISEHQAHTEASVRQGAEYRGPIKWKRR